MLGKSVAVSHLLARLMEIPGKERHSRDSQRLIQAKNTDYCQECKNIIEDQCVRYGDQRWHIACFQCKKCERSLTTTSGSVMNGQLYCTTCVHASPCTFDYVSRLAQYSYLLRIALSRLCSLLQITGKKKSLKRQEEALLIFSFRFTTFQCGLFNQVKQCQGSSQSYTKRYATKHAECVHRTTADDGRTRPHGNYLSHRDQRCQNSVILYHAIRPQDVTVIQNGQ